MVGFGCSRCAVMVGRKRDNATCRTAPRFSFEKLAPIHYFSSSSVYQVSWWTCFSPAALLLVILSSFLKLPHTEVASSSLLHRSVRCSDRELQALCTLRLVPRWYHLSSIGRVSGVRYSPMNGRVSRPLTILRLRHRRSRSKPWLPSWGTPYHHFYRTALAVRYGT